MNFKLNLAELPTGEIAANGEEGLGEKGKDNEALEGVVVSDLDSGTRREIQYSAGCERRPRQ